MASLKLYYKLGIIGSLLVIIIGVIVILLNQLTSYISIFGTVSAGQEITSNIIFGVIALLGTEFSRRKKDIGITAMTTISIAGIIAYPGIFDIGYIIVLVAVLLFFFEGNKKSSE
jgi:hypothetical protein